MEFKVEKGILWIKRGKEWRIQTCPYPSGSQIITQCHIGGNNTITNRGNENKVYCGEWCPLFGEVIEEETCAVVDTSDWDATKIANFHAEIIKPIKCKLKICHSELAMIEIR